MAAEATERAETQARSGGPAWVVVAAQELRDLWLSGRGLALLLAFTALLSVTTYVVASNQELNFLEQREAVSLTLQVSVTVGALLVVLAAADSVAGERERGTLEGLLLTPASRQELVVGKGLAALSLWAAAYVVSLPYLWWLGRDIGTFGTAAVGSLVVGSLLSLFLAAAGMLVSIFSSTSRYSVSLSFFLLLALYAPHQMPTEATRGWVGEMLLRIDPVTGGLTYLERLVLNEHVLSQDVRLLVAPLLAAVVLPLLTVVAARRLSLLPRERS